ncbi:MAG: hypothetical protein WD180_06495, partial [Pseudohongiellaceae bacterium]
MTKCGSSLTCLATALLVITLARPASAGSDGSANVSSGCATLEFMAKLTALNIVLPADHDNWAQLRNIDHMLKEMNRLICQPVILTAHTRGNTRYANGSLASSDLYHNAWYFPNGQLFLAEPGADARIHYPNGVVMAYHWMHGDSAVFWPNGSLATNYFRAFDEAWYYPDGNVITYEAGYSGGRWFYPFARLDGGTGQEVISSEWGVEDESF